MTTDTCSTTPGLAPDAAAPGFTLTPPHAPGTMTVTKRDGRPNVALADFVAPEGQADWIGGFAVTAGILNFLLGGVGAVLVWRATCRPKGILQALGQSDEALAAQDDMRMSEARPRQPDSS